MPAHALTWWTIFRIALEERLVYRGDFALGTLMRFLPIITQIFLWWAIFSTLAGGVEGGRLADYSFANMVAYYLLTMIARAFSSMPGLSSGVALQIRNGEIKKFLIQPVDMVGFLLVQRVAHKLAYYSVALIPFALVFAACYRFFPEGWPDFATLGAFVLSLLMGFLIGYFLEVSIGLIGFWFLEVSSLLFVYMLFSFFLSGHMFPLDLLPEEPVNIRAMVEFLPLQYLAYFPSAIFLKKITGEALVRGLLIEAAWLLFFIVLSRVMWKLGVRRYSGFGG